IGTGLKDTIVDEKGFEEGNMRIGSCGGTVAGVDTFSGGGEVTGMSTSFGESGVGVGVEGLDEVCGLCEGWGPNMDG
ncbi:hypothetical protein FCV25MIE_07585, partial [Fagus crenata]